MKKPLFPLAVLAVATGIPSETFIRRHMEGLLPGQTVVVVLRTASATAPWDVAGPVYCVGKPQWGRLKRLFSLGRNPQNLVSFLKEHGVKAMLGEYLDASHPHLFAVKEAGIRFIAHAHGYDVSAQLRHEKWRQAYRDYQHADGVVVPGRYHREKLTALGLDAAKIHIIPCGVDIPVESSRSRGGSEIHCLAVGRMTGKKGPFYLAEAFRQAAFKESRLRLHWCGGGVMEEGLKQYVRAAGLEKYIFLCGEQPHEHVLKEMKQADLFLQHSLTNPENGDEEGLPVGILEAMAHGLPVVSTKHASIPEAVNDGVTGFVTNPGNVREMTDQILDLAADSDKRSAMGQRGRAAAIEKFSWVRERKALLELLTLEEFA